MKTYLSGFTREVLEETKPLNQIVHRSGLRHRATRQVCKARRRHQRRPYHRLRGKMRHSAQHPVSLRLQVYQEPPRNLLHLLLPHHRPLQMVYPSPSGTSSSELLRIERPNRRLRRRINRIMQFLQSTSSTLRSIMRCLASQTSTSPLVPAHWVDL